MQTVAQPCESDDAERSRLKAALRAGEARHRAMMEAAPDCIVMVGGDGRILEFNAAAEATFGWTRQAVIGRRVSEVIIPAPMRDQHDRGLAAFGLPGTGTHIGRSLERTAMRSDGTEFPIEIAVMPIEEEGGGRVFMAVMRDISRRKRGQAEVLAAKNTAEAAVRAKSALLTTMSHEVRTPLNAILGAAELLEEARLDTDSMDLVAIVQSNARALLVLLNALLDSAKLEAGQLRIEEVRYDPRDVVDDVAETLAGAASAKGLELVAVVDAAVPPRLVGDAGRIRQILLNIGDNAVKFTARGEITLSADVRDGRELHFYVKDTGIGIGASDQARIFEPFTQLANGEQRAAGTGLGLGISRSLAALMGGRLELESELERGSIFHLYLPLRRDEESNGDEVPRRRLGGVEAVVIVPHGALRAMVGGVLRHAGCTVTETADIAHGMAALEQMPRPEPLVIVDCQAPDFPGSERLARDVARLTGGKPHLVHICAHGAVACGAHPRDGVSCVRRPVRPRALVKAAERARMRRRPPAHPEPAGAGQLTDQRPVILIAEDAPDGRALLERALRDAPFQAVFASNGREAVEAFARAGASIVLLDVDMPVMDGYAAARAIRLMESGAHLPIVALTGHTGPTSQARCRAAGFDALLTKPVGKQELLRIVGEFLPAPPVAVATHIADLVPAFLENRRSDSRRLPALLAERNLEEIRRIGHNMKSTGAGYGFEAMSVIGGELEAAAGAGDEARIRILAGQLERHLASVSWTCGEDQ